MIIPIAALVAGRDIPSVPPAPAPSYSVYSRFVVPLQLPFRRQTPSSVAQVVSIRGPECWGTPHDRGRERRSLEARIQSNAVRTLSPGAGRCWGRIWPSGARGTRRPTGHRLAALPRPRPRCLVNGAHAIQSDVHDPPQHEDPNEADACADRCQPHAVFESCELRLRAAPQRHAQADLMLALQDRKRHHSVNAEGGEHKRQNGE
jgi:hypothetical protein